MSDGAHLRKVVLHGELGDRFGREWTLDVGSAKEALHAIDKQRNGKLFEYMATAHESGVGFSVLVGGKDVFPESAQKVNEILSVEKINEDHRHALEGVNFGLRFPLGNDTLDIVPMPFGAGDNSGWIMIVVGVLLIAAAILLGPAGWIIGGVGLGWITSTSILTAVILVGVSLAINGITSLIMSPGSMSSSANGLNAARLDQDTGEEPDERVSKNFSGAVNTTGTGEAVPVVLGRVITGSHMISFGIQSQAGDE